MKVWMQNRKHLSHSHIHAS